MERYDYYDPDGAPYMVLNGTAAILGASDYDELYAELAEMTRDQLDSTRTSWFIVLRDLEELSPYDPSSGGGESYRVTACVTLVDQPEDEIPVLYGFAYKTGIAYQNPFYPEQDRFDDVVRVVEGPVALKEPPYGLDTPGESAEIVLEFSFPTGELFENPETPEPDFEGYGIVVVVQGAADFPNGPIRQATRLEWRR
jgi:hypothetical protein